MSDETDAAAEVADEHDEHHPRGTFILLLAFLAVTAGDWIWAYYALLERHG